MIPKPNEVRLQTLREFLSQAGKRLSSESKRAIQDAIDKLQSLIGEDDADEQSIEQSFSASQMLLCQGMVTGISVATTYEMLIAKIDRALRKDSSLPGNWRYSLYTDPEWVAFVAFSWDDEWEAAKTFIADYVDDGSTVTFSNVRECSIETIIRVIDDIDFDLSQEELVKQAQSVQPEIYMQDGPKGAMLLQLMKGTVHCQKRKDGRIVIQGVATHGDVPNRYQTPVVFPTACWQAELASMQELIRQGKAIGCLGHPSTEQGDYREAEPQEYCIKFTKLEQDGDLFPFEAISLTNSTGKDFAAMVDDGVRFDMSTVSFGKVKKQDWKGHESLVVQPEGFKWVRIADVVLEGASPGAEITEVRLQAINAEPGTGAIMNEKEIRELFESLMQARQTGDAAQTAALQAKLDEAMKTLEQMQQKSALTEEQTKLLEQADVIVKENEAAKTLQARDAKVDEIIGAMVQAKELPEQFKPTARGLFQGHAATPEAVEGAKPAVLNAMKSLLDQHAVLQSKGLYTPEYQRDGEAKIVVDTPAEAIEDLVQTAIKREKIKDTGIDDPSNPARNARKMLQTLALDQPAYAVAHMRMRNGDAGSVDDMTRFLQTRYGMLTQEIPTGAMTTTDVAAAIPYVLPIVMEMVPQLIAARYASLQPMERSKGTIAYWKIYDQDGGLLKDKSTFTGSYAQDPGEKQTMKKLKGKLTTSDITPQAKKLGYDLSVEVIRRLRTDWGMDATSVMIEECAAEIAREWNYNHLAAMVQGATGGNWNYGTAIPADSSFDGKEWQEQLMNYVTFAEAGIGDKCGANTVAIVGGRTSIARAVIIARKVGILSDTGVGQGQIASGVNIAGSTVNGEELVSVDWWHDVVADNKLLLIARGNKWYKSGYIVAPYLGLYVTPQWVDPGTLDVEQGMLSEVGEEMVNGDYFGTITIQEGTAGTPL